MKGTDGKSSEAVRQSRVAACDQLRDDKAKKEDQQKTNRTHREHLSATVEDVERQALEEKAALNLAKRALSQTEANLRTLSENESDANKLQLFGQRMPRLVESIRKNRGRFSRPPIGPLGCEVKIRPSSSSSSPELDADNRLVENELKDLLSAFMVSSFADKHVLDELQEVCGTAFKVIKSCCSFDAAPYDVSMGRCAHDKYLTVYD